MVNTMFSYGNLPKPIAGAGPFMYPLLVEDRRSGAVYIDHGIPKSHDS